MDLDHCWSAFNKPAEPAPTAPEPKLYRPNLNITLSCPECRTANLIEDFSTGDMICGDCGLVLGDRIIDTRSEWRTFADGDKGGADPVRVGAAANPFLASSGLDTDIGFRDGFSGRARELARVQDKSAPKTDLRLLAVFKDIDDLAGPVHLPKTVIDIAKEIYKKVDDAKVCKNKFSGLTVVAGCLLIACRQANVPRSFTEIGALTRVSKNDIGRVYKIIQSHLVKDSARKRSDPRTRTTETAYLPTGGTSAADLMSRFCNRLHLSAAVDAMCSAFARRVSESGILGGRSPTTTAAAGIYFISHFVGMGRTLGEVADAAGVSEATVRVAYRLLYASRDELVEPEWIARGRGSIEGLPRA